jgi:hypothetical protein
MRKTLATATCRGTIRTAMIVNGARGRRYIRVFLTGMGTEPLITLPESLARSLYDQARRKGSPVLYESQDMLMAHARILCKWLQRRACKVRVFHVRLDDERDMWIHDVVEVTHAQTG